MSYSHPPWVGSGSNYRWAPNCNGFAAYSRPYRGWATNSPYAIEVPTLVALYDTAKRVDPNSSDPGIWLSMQNMRK